MAVPPDRDHTASTATKCSALREREVTDYRGTAESLLPVSEASVTQLRPGPEPTNLELFSSDNLSVMALQHHAASVGVVVVKPEYCAFMWWDGNEDCRINGRPVSHSEIYAQGAQDGFHAAGGARRTIGIAVRRNDLADTLASLTGVGPEDVLLRRASLKLSPEVAYRFRSDVDELLRGAIGQSRDAAAAVNPSEAIFGLLVDAYLRSPPVLQRDERPRQPERIVRLAEERFFASQGTKVSLADLCAATGVSQSALYHAFGVVCGAPPLAYFRRRRLTEARRALKGTPAYSGAVKDAALAAGLTELGRFSVEYRQLFGGVSLNDAEPKRSRLGSSLVLHRLPIELHNRFVIFA